MTTQPLTLFAYSSSHRIERVGQSTLLKNMSDAALTEPARGNRHRYHDPRREPEVYRRLLQPLSLGVLCTDAGEDWIVMEELAAVPLWEVGDPAVWISVARYVACLHAAIRQHIDDLPLVVHDDELFRFWRQRAHEAGVDRFILDAHARASARLTGLRRDMIHGDLYPSNILVRPRAESAIVDVWPIDWELAGLGPAVLDVAALTSGDGLSPATRTAMETAYLEVALGRAGAWQTWRRDLDAARLHLCVQWLGWSGEWDPPADHRHDWHHDARRLAALF